MKTLRKPRLRQYFALHSNVVVANDDVHVKVLEPFEIKVWCMLHDHLGNDCFELSVSFKYGKSFMKAFELGSVEEMKGITKEDLIGVWKCRLMEEMMDNSSVPLGEIPLTGRYSTRKKLSFVVR